MGLQPILKVLFIFSENNITVAWLQYTEWHFCWNYLFLQLILQVKKTSMSPKMKYLLVVYLLVSTFTFTEGMYKVWHKHATFDLLIWSWTVTFHIWLSLCSSFRCVDGLHCYWSCWHSFWSTSGHKVCSLVFLFSTFCEFFFRFSWLNTTKCQFIAKTTHFVVSNSTISNL